jgi:hypothetical protein
MAVNCNKVASVLQAFDQSAPFDDDTIEAKSSFGRSASMSVNSALSDCYKAIETLEMSRATIGAEVVYLRAAINKLETAERALRGMREILARGRTTDAFDTWVETLDYDRLYEAGTKRGLIPAGIEQWKRLVELMRSPDHLAATDGPLIDVEELQREIYSLVDALISNTPGAPLTAEHTERVLIVQTALIKFSIFAQLAAYLNAVEPMDKTWSKRIDMADLVKAR